MSEQVIELDLEPSRLPPVRRRGVVFAMLAGAIVLAGASLAASRHQAVPHPAPLGAVVRATSIDVCESGDFVGLTVYVVNEDSQPITLTSADAAAGPDVSDVSAGVFPDGAGSPCFAGWKWTDHNQVSLQPGDLGLVVVSYRASCALRAAVAPPVTHVAVHLTEGKQAAVRAVAPGPDDLAAAAGAGTSNCDLPPNPSAETAS